MKIYFNSRYSQWINWLGMILVFHTFSPSELSRYYSFLEWKVVVEIYYREVSGFPSLLYLTPFFGCDLLLLCKFLVSSTWCSKILKEFVLIYFVLNHIFGLSMRFITCQLRSSCITRKCIFVYSIFLYSNSRISVVFMFGYFLSGFHICFLLIL